MLMPDRLTKDASLAELTSLEEMMRIMMEDDQIHGDIVNRLWQVYSACFPSHHVWSSLISIFSY